MVNFIVAPSKIHGNGVFAYRYFISGEEIGYCLKPIFKVDMSPDKEYGYSNVSEKLNTVVEKTFLEKYLNHSTSPNAELFFKNEMQLWLRATKRIQPQEEIVVDYRDAFPKIDKLQEVLVKKNVND